MDHPGNDREVPRSIEDMIVILRSKGVRLWVEDGALRYRAKKGTVTPEDIVSLRQSEAKIRSLLSAFNAVAQFEPRLVKRPHATRAPLAFSQLVYWNLRESMQRRPVRQVASVTRLRGKLNLSVLEEALSEVVRRHEALRTRVITLSGVPMQEVEERNRSALDSLDFRGLPSIEQTSRIKHCINSSILDVADYAVDPLFRAVLLRLDTRESVMILALDHVISDGVSLNILQNDIFTIYAAMMRGRQASLSPVGMHCIDYALWQRAQLIDLRRDHADACANLGLTRFPSDQEVARGQGWGAIRFALGVHNKTALQSWARHRGTSLTMVVLNLYIALVLRWCQTCETVVQVMIDGRTGRLLDQTVACVAFPLYVHVLVEGHESLVDLFEIVTKEYCRAYEQPDFFQSYVQNPVSPFTRNTLFNWLPHGAMRGAEQMVLQDESVTFAPVRFENPLLERFRCEAEPTVVLEESPDDLLGEVHFQKERFSRNLMQRFVDNFRSLVNAFVETPTISIRDTHMI